MCKITIPIREYQKQNKTFDEFYNNDDNNVITFRDQNFFWLLYGSNTRKGRFRTS